MSACEWQMGDETCGKRSRTRFTWKGLLARACCGTHAKVADRRGWTEVQS